jgi:hypothetical protein
MDAQDRNTHILPTSRRRRLKALIWVLWFLGGTAALLIGFRLFNELAWRENYDYTAWWFTNGPTPLYGFWAEGYRGMRRELWPWSQLAPRLVPIGVAAAWIGVVCWIWRAISRPELARGARIALRVAVPLITPLFAFALYTTLAMSNGGERALTDPFERSGLEYFGDIHVVQDKPLQFVRDYAKLSLRRGVLGGNYLISIHGATHPPGPTLFLWWVTRKFEDPPRPQETGWFRRPQPPPRANDPMPAALATIAVTSLAPIATWWLARCAFGRREPDALESARSADRVGLAAAALHVVTPSLALFGATCVDGIFILLPTLGSAALFAGFAARKWWVTIALAVLAGAFFAGGVFLTFGTVCFGVIFALDLLLNLRGGGWKRRLAALAIVCAVVAGTYLTAYVAIGYDVLENLKSAMTRNDRTVGTGYETGRRYWSLSHAHVVTMLIGVGAAASWLWLARSFRGVWNFFRRERSGDGDRFVVAYTLAVVALAYSTLFTLEVERVWMFLMPPAIAAAASALERKFRIGTGALALLLFLAFAQTWWMEWKLYVYW